MIYKQNENEQKKIDMYCDFLKKNALEEMDLEFLGHRHFTALSQLDVNNCSYLLIELR